MSKNCCRSTLSGWKAPAITAQHDSWIGNPTGLSVLKAGARISTMGFKRRMSQRSSNFMSGSSQRLLVSIGARLSPSTRLPTPVRTAGCTASAAVTTRDQVGPSAQCYVYLGYCLGKERENGGRGESVSHYRLGSDSSMDIRPPPRKKRSSRIKRSKCDRKNPYLPRLRPNVTNVKTFRLRR